jgi:hypothetical protein
MSGWVWHDINNGNFIDDDNYGEYLGHVKGMDLWLTNTRVLICQYEDEDIYRSYHPPGAIIHYAKGGEQNEKVLDWDIKTKNNRQCLDPTWWGVNDDAHSFDTAKYIARYLAMFTSDVFTDEEKQEALGFTLTETEN